ncbi:hypothetical protein [Saccharothrix sp. HUAS TT1]|uniref:hypothetical protein n=1 Tax=unclassified Saccharothrix TaxID=2593673 RepID=UPI00345B84CE
MTTPHDPDNRPPYVPPPPPLSESELNFGNQGGYAQPVGPAPKQLQISFWLWIAGAALLVLSSVLILTEREEAIKAARDAGGTQGLTEEQFVTTVTATLAVLVTIGVVLAALMAFFAFKARAGRNWARVSLTVLGALIFLFQMLAVSQLGLLIMLAVAAAVVTLYLPASKQYFDSVKRAG